MNKVMVVTDSTSNIPPQLLNGQPDPGSSFTGYLGS